MKKEKEVKIMRHINFLRKTTTYCALGLPQLKGRF